MFDVVNGYSKRTFDVLLEQATVVINEQFNTNYTKDTITGSNQFKTFYAGLQLLMETENKINDLENKIIDYIRTTNESIASPISSVDGTVQYFKKNLNLNVALRPINDVTMAGKPAIAVDVDPSSPTFAALKQQIFDALRISQTEGLYWFNPSTSPASNEYRGESSALNGQAFPFCFFVPTVADMQVRITITRSRDNLSYQLNPTQISDKFKANFAAQYTIGRDFEGERYLSICDVPSAANIKVEWSTNGTTWTEGVRQMNFDTKINITNVIVQEA